MKSNSMDLNAIHIWQHNPYLDSADIMIWTELKLVLMSGLIGWWCISPFACAYSRELTPEFVATFFKLRSNAYRLFRSVFKNNEVEELADEYFDLPENHGRRDLDVEGWLVNSYFSEFDEGKPLPNATIYRGNDKAKLLNLMGGCTWYEFRSNAKWLGEMIASADTSPEELTRLFRDVMDRELEHVHQFGFPKLCSLVTPHATVSSAFPTSEFVAKATEVKNGWYSIMHKLRKGYPGLPKPVLTIGGSATSLKDLNSVECGTMTRTRINRTQKVIHHTGSIGHLKRFYPIKHLVSTLFKEAPLPSSLTNPLDSRHVSNKDRFLFFTETLPLLRRNNLDLDDDESDTTHTSSLFGDFERVETYNDKFSEPVTRTSKIDNLKQSDRDGFHSLDSVPNWLREYFPPQEQQNMIQSLNQQSRLSNPTDIGSLTHFSVESKREMIIREGLVEHKKRTLEHASF